MSLSRTQVWLTVLGLTGLLFAAGPSRTQEVQWRDDYNAARREAKQKNLPLLLDFGTTDCFWCKKLDASTFRDPAVVKVLNEQFVPLKIDGEKESNLTQALRIQSFPTLVFADSDGKILGVQEGFVEAAEFKQQSQRVQANAMAPSRQPETSPSPAPAPLKSPATPPVPGAYKPPSPEPAASAPDRAQLARGLLVLAQSDYRARQYVSCLERCTALVDCYADLPEGQEARRLAATIKSDPQCARRACAELTDRLGELYLELAENSVRQNQPEQALAYLQRILLVCPGTSHAQTAQLQLTRLQPQLAGEPDSTPKARAQSP